MCTVDSVLCMCVHMCTVCPSMSAWGAGGDWEEAPVTMATCKGVKPEVTVAAVETLSLSKPTQRTDKGGLCSFWPLCPHACPSPGCWTAKATLLNPNAPGLRCVECMTPGWAGGAEPESQEVPPSALAWAGSRGWRGQPEAPWGRGRPLQSALQGPVPLSCLLLSLLLLGSTDERGPEGDVHPHVQTVVQVSDLGVHTGGGRRGLGVGLAVQ